MKKTLFAAVCIVLSLLFTGCTTQTSSISYSHKFGYMLPEDSDGLLETFTYNVISDENVDTSGITAPFLIDGQGIYTVNIYKEGEVEFRITTDFTFTGNYILSGGEVSVEFNDTITSEATATIDANNFIPHSSTKTFATSLPITETNESEVSSMVIKKAYYTAQTNYTKTSEGYKISSTVTDNQTDENAYKIQNETNKNFNYETKNRIVDNEFIFLQLRLQNTLSQTFSDSFNLADPLNGIMQSISVSTSQNSETKEFYDYDNPQEKIDYDCFVFSAAISGKYTGSNMVMYYTQSYPVKYQKNEEGEPLTYSNIALLLEMKHNNLIYTLDSYTNNALKVD